ncbi:hypothetical protein NPX13_g8492 [Xylaria arbuscula]|uniref:Uncharacterized protein n=1 Tax=Xylaria arbuscula TaxID=114810 RepID=A0A9W8TK39_9PEZI|nr:hypothetical protein NPX13_g8492 [Xylaria arbuscula]
MASLSFLAEKNISYFTIPVALIAIANMKNDCQPIGPMAPKPVRLQGARAEVLRPREPQDLRLKARKV